MEKDAEMERIKFQINFLRYSRGNVMVLRNLIEDALQILDPWEDDLQSVASFTTLSRNVDKYLAAPTVYNNESLLQQNFSISQQQAIRDIDHLITYLKEKA